MLKTIIFLQNPTLKNAKTQQNPTLKTILASTSKNFSTSFEKNYYFCKIKKLIKDNGL